MVNNLRIQLIRIRVLRNELIPIKLVPIPPSKDILLKIRLPRPQIERVDALVAVAGGLQERVPAPRDVLVGSSVGEDMAHVGVEKVPREGDEGEGD